MLRLLNTIVVGGLVLAVLWIASGSTEYANPVMGEPPTKYVPKFGLDPIGQAIVRGREETLDQERRIRLLERQVAQLQRIVFQDPTIQPPSYPDKVPRPRLLDTNPIGDSGQNDKVPVIGKGE